MRTADLKSAFLGVVAAGISSLCCLLPLAVILLGLGSGAFMATTMRYRAIFLPAGVLGVGLGWLLYLREGGRCTSLGCRRAGRPLNLGLLLLATLVVAAALVLDLFPNVTADVLTRAMARPSGAVSAPAPMTGHSTMSHPEDAK